MKQHNYQRWFILALLTTLWGCPTLGIVEPETFEQRLAYAYSVNTGIREASTSSLNAGTISSEDMIYIMGVNNNLRLALDAARQSSQIGDLDTAEARLVMVVNSLAALQQYMRGRVDP